MGSQTGNSGNSYVGIDLDNMIKGKFKKTILRRDSDTSAFRPPAPPQSISETSIPTSELVSITRQPPRTKDDESIFINTGVITPMATESPPKLSRKTTNGTNGHGKTSASAQYFPDDTPYSYAPSIHSSKSSSDNQQQYASSNTNFDDFIDGLNIGMIGDFLKTISSSIWFRIQNSKYVNTDNDGRLHLQSFCIGIIMTSIVVMVQPYLVVYLDSWIVLLGRLFKHLMAWIMVAAVLSYIFKTKKQDENGKDLRKNNFDQRSIKTQSTSARSRSSSPSKSSLRSKKPYRDRQSFSKHQIPSLTPLQQQQPIAVSNKNNNQDQLMLMNITEQAQEAELERIGNNNKGIGLSNGFPNEDIIEPDFKLSKNENYNEFMKIAIEKDKQHQKYNKFVDDNRTGIKNMVINVG